MNYFFNSTIISRAFCFIFSLFLSFVYVFFSLFLFVFVILYFFLVFEKRLVFTRDGVGVGVGVVSGVIKSNGIGVRRMRTFPFLGLLYLCYAYDLVIGVGSRSRRKDKPITIHVPTHCDWFSFFRLCFRLRHSGFHQNISGP